MKWINFLHIYQPPTQSKEVVVQVSNESYFKILDLLSEYPTLKLTLNLSGSLLELWEKYGLTELIEGYKKFLEEKRIELVGSAMYHPIMPLISTGEARAQIELHNAICKRFFGDAYSPRGFYLPEMAYSDETGALLKELGYSWIILDDIHAGIDPITAYDSLPTHILYRSQSNGLEVVFRNHVVSRTFPPEYILTNYDQSKTSYLITAHDGELYGHWHKDDKGYYHKIFGQSGISTLTVSEYIAELKVTGAPYKDIPLRAASWESTPSELAEHIPFALWNDKQNMIHTNLWELSRFVDTTITNAITDTHYPAALTHLHRGMASCAWWWANERILGPFSPICWNPEEIEKGATELIRAVRSLSTLPISIRNEAETKFGTLRTMIWTHHWKLHEK